MNKILLIIKREYLTRVRKRTFIISTLLFPILYMLLVFGTGYIAATTKQVLRVAIIDASGYFNAPVLEKQNTLDKSSVLVPADPGAADSIKTDPQKAGFDGYIVIPSLNWKTGDSLVLQSKKSIASSNAALIASKLNTVWDEVKNEKLGIDASNRAILTSSRLSVKANKINDPNANGDTAAGIGFACGFLIYFIILIYGSQVMTGVMEEKTSRIAEIIVSSVKPFQMMLGKIIGIGLVALTQFLLWVLFMFAIYNVTKMSGGAASSSANQFIGSIQKIFSSVNLPLVLSCFAFYFLGGFFFYSAIYGAIGSAINEDIREAQSLSFPVTMLVIISIVIMTTVAANPTGPMATWASIIPFSSPIVMMARIPWGVPDTVPWWQLTLSMSLLVAGFVFTTWFAGKIYRTGILMYGKKPSWKEMIKWAFRRN
ncbi:MAG: ABC transporter permease [Bacteroidota bacterium]|nr:ABC transporter permease [Bacteroidota bacterium]